MGTGTTRRREKRLRPLKPMPGKGGRTPQSYSECIDRALMHDAPGKWGSRSRDSRCIPHVEGMLALVKLGRRSIDRGIKWAKMLEYCRETRKQAEVVPVTALVLAPPSCASPQGDKIKQTSSLS